MSPHAQLVEISAAHLRRISVLLLNLVLNRRHVFGLVGWLNQRKGFLSSVFVVYPASKSYALSYIYARHLHLLQWRPWLVGIFRQNGKWGVTLAIASTEEDFCRDCNTEELRGLLYRTEDIRKWLHADQKTFSGILPGILSSKGIADQHLEADVTVEVVLEAERQVRQLENIEAQVPTIILGGQGFIGRRLLSRMNDRETYCVDIASDEYGWDSLPTNLATKGAVLLNVSRRSALSEYIPMMWPGMTVINEVYPEPDRTCVEELGKRSIPVYHVVGVRGQAFPPFPRAYQGGIPACSARSTPDMEVLVRKLI